MAENPFHGEQLQGVKYSRANMADAEFDGVNLKNARFWVVMEGAQFTDSNLAATNFDDVTFAGSQFHNINFAGTKITNANLSGLTISDANLSGASISNANLSGMTINGVLVSDLFAAFEAQQKAED